MTDVDERISAALHAATDTVQDRDLRPDLATPARRRNVLAPLLSAAAVLCIGVTVAVVAARHEASPTVPAGGAPLPTSPAVSVPATPDPPSGNVSAAALEVVRNRLGFTGLGSTSPSLVETGNESWAVFVGQGYDAKVSLRLAVRSAPVDDSGLWEISGTTTDVTTDGPMMTIGQPSYGSHVSGTVTVAGSAPGQTTGTVQVSVLARGSSDPIATGQANIGTDGSWQTDVPLPDTASGPLTVAATYGGTDTAPAEFAVTGVYAAGS